MTILINKKTCISGFIYEEAHDLKMHDLVDKDRKLTIYLESASFSLQVLRA